MATATIYAVDPYGSGRASRGLKIADALSPSFRCRVIVAPHLGPRVAGERAHDVRVLPVASTRSRRRREELKRLLSPQPDLLIVDCDPCGEGGELIETLSRRAGPSVLSYRDFAGSPSTVERDFAGARSAGRGVQIARSRYSEVWAFCPPHLDPLAGTVASAAARGRHRSLGLLGWARRGAGRARARVDVTLTAGAGGDGFALRAALRDIAASGSAPGGIRVVAGLRCPAPLRDALSASCAEHGADFVSDASDFGAILAATRAVVGMSGYNTVAECAAAGVPGLWLPRRPEGEEQHQRACESERAGTGVRARYDGRGFEDLRAPLCDVLSRDSIVAPAGWIATPSDVLRAARAVLEEHA